MALTTTIQKTPEQIVATVDELTNGNGDSGWIPMGAEGVESFMVLAEAASNPTTSAVTIELEGAWDAAGTGATSLSAAAGFAIEASVSTAGVATAGLYRVAPPYVRVKQHSNAGADLNVVLAGVRRQGK